MIPRSLDQDTLAPTLLIGLGTPHGDDAVGMILAERLSDGAEEQGLARLRVRVVNRPIDILDDLESFARLIVLDACLSERPIGHLDRWSWPHDDWETVRSTGSHDLSLPDVLTLAERLGRLPSRVAILGITIAPSIPAADFRLSDPLNAALPELLRQVRNEILHGDPVAATAPTGNRTFENGSRAKDY